MMISVTKEDAKLERELDEWWVLNEFGEYCLKEDTPEYLKKHDEKMRKKYEALPD